MEVLVRLQDIAFYRQHGYWLSPRISRALEVLRDHLERVVNGEYETKRPLLVHTPTPGDLSEVVQVLNAHWADGHHSAGSAGSVAGAIAAKLAGTEGIRLFHDQLICKPPDLSEANHIGWHQDLGYWTCIDDKRMLAA